MSVSTTARLEPTVLWSGGGAKPRWESCSLRPAAGLGVLYGQAEENPDQGSKERAHGDQELAAAAKRSVHRASKAEPTSQGCRNLFAQSRDAESRPDHELHQPARHGDGKTEFRRGPASMPLIIIFSVEGSD